MQIRRLAFGCGAEITGVDLREELPQEAIDAIRHAWLEHMVVVFPGQDIGIEQQVRFSRRFGTLEQHPAKNLRSTLAPEIMEIHNRVIDGKPSQTADVGRIWHSDGAYTTCPPTGSFLHCRAMPEAGGNTWFTNMAMAFEALSPTMQGMIDGLEVINPALEFIGKTDAAISLNAGGTVSVWTGLTIGSESDSGINISAYNRWRAIPSANTLVRVTWADWCEQSDTTPAFC